MKHKTRKRQIMKKTHSLNELEQIKMQSESIVHIEEGTSRIYGFGIIGDVDDFNASEMFIAPADNTGDTPFAEILRTNPNSIGKIVTGNGYKIGIAKTSEKAIAVYNGKRSTYNPDDEDFDRSKHYQDRPVR